MAPPNEDDDLLARLNALKSSSIELCSSQGDDQTDDDDLAARFLRFSNANKTSVPAARPSEQALENPVSENPEDDRTIEELLADIGPDDQWVLDPDEPKNIEKLMNEAKASLDDKDSETKSTHSEPDDEIDSASKANDELSIEAQAEAESTIKAASDLKTDATDPDTNTNDDGRNTHEDDEADEALQRILEELSLENALIDQDLVPRDTKPISEDTPASTLTPKKPITQLRDDDDSAFNLPSTPDTAPVARDPTNEAQSDGFALPSAPTSKPGKNIPKSNLPTYTNEEIDTWCVICNDDATVLCKGCDGDLYCAKCWKEGHTGPDVGFEERTHRWTKYTKPR